MFSRFNRGTCQRASTERASRSIGTGKLYSTIQYTLTIRAPAKFRYPEVALNRPNQRKEVLESIFDLYVKKDLVDYLKVEKMLKRYYQDNGVRNYFVKNFNPTFIRADAGYLFEGYVISELVKKGVPANAIKFWRTKAQVEADILPDQNERQIPLEIKHKEKISRKDLKG